jgi:CrcB protein
MKEKSRGAEILLTLICVFFGGAIGAGIRAGFGFLSRGWSWPWVIFAINLTGAFLLGLLDSLVAAKSSAHPGFKKFSSFVGTGMMGAFTTYGTFVDGVRGQFLSSLQSAAVGYALSSLVAGVFLAGLGLYIGKKIFKEAK